MILQVIALIATGILLVTWVGYPAVLWLLGRLRPFARQGSLATGDGDARVSVVIASREPAAAIVARVANVLNTKYPSARLEFVVSLDRPLESGDSEIAALDPDRIRIVPGEGAGKAAALNAGVAAATGSVIVFGDTYQRYLPTTIPELVAALSDPAVGAVTGRLVLPKESAFVTRTYWAYETWLRRTEASVHSTVGVTGAVYAVRRELWKPLPADLLLDDVYTPMQVVLAGYRVVFADKARALELRPIVPAKEYSRKVRTLTGVVQVCAWLPAVLAPARNPIWVQFVMHKLMRMATPYALLLVVVLAVAHSLAFVAGNGVYGATAATALVLAVVWVSRSSHPHAVATCEIAREALLLQAAVAVAGWNGMRRRWTVWNG
jgi:poly-beta-1,6-N-acetyl-D-glucosamine synthase